ncbi:MAG: DUF4175 family protein [Nitrospinota bacterium]
MSQQDHRWIVRFLDRVVLRLRAFQLAEALLLLLLATEVIFLLGLGAAAFQSSFPYSALLYLVLSGAIGAAALAVGLLPLLRRVPRSSAALAVEARDPRLMNNLINSLQLYPQLERPEKRRDISEALVHALVRQTRRELGGIEPRAVVSAERARRLGATVVVLLAAAAGVLFLDPSAGPRSWYLLRNAFALIPPREVRLSIEPRQVTLLRGEPLAVEVRASGRVPERVELRLTPEGAPPGSAEMAPKGEGRFRHVVENPLSSFSFQAAADGFASAVGRARVVAPPEVGELRLTYYAPAYTGLPPRVVKGKGDIQGLKGSRVEVASRATKPVTEGKIVLDTGWQIPMRIQKGVSLQGQLVLLQPGEYHIQVKDELGYSNPDPIRYRIQLVSDQHPWVRVLAPGRDLTLEEEATVRVEYEARDDYGLRAVDLEFRVGSGRWRRIRLWEGKPERRLARGHQLWDLATMGLAPGAVVHYRLAAVDNDTISGPKTGYSPLYRIRFPDRRAARREMAAQLRELSEGLLELLGDYLERDYEPQERTSSAAPRPAGPRTPAPAAKGRAKPPSLRQKADRLLQKVDRAIARLRPGRPSETALRMDLEALRRNLAYTRDELLEKAARAPTPEARSRAREETASELERLATLSEDLYKGLQAERLQDTLAELSRSQRELLRSLERLQKGASPAARQAALKELAKLEQLLRSAMRSLGQLASKMPDDFINNPALRNLPFQDMRSALGAVRRHLQRGDIRAALQAMRQLLGQLRAMMAALQNARWSSLRSALSRMRQGMNRSGGELAALVREQDAILRQTEAVERKLRVRQEKRWKEELAELESSLSRLLAELKKRKEQPAQPPAEGLRKALREGGAPPDAKRRKELRASFGRLREAMREKLLPEERAELERWGERLGKLPSETDRLAGPEELRGLTELHRRQAALEGRTREFHRTLERLMQLFPNLDPKIAKGIEGAAQAMGEAKKELGAQSARRALPPERTALERLLQSQQSIGQALRQMAQRAVLGPQRGPAFYGARRWLPWGRLIPQPGVDDFPATQGEEGALGFERREFRLPGKEEFRVPPGFREAIMEALREGAPSDYRERIERYFESITK